LNVFGPGLRIIHPGTIIVNPNTRVGANCGLHNLVHIARNTQKRPHDAGPTIGDNVFIGPGSGIFGDITIADGVVIGANSVVTKSVLEPNITVAGAPARKIGNEGIDSTCRPGERDDLIRFVAKHADQFSEKSSG
jgi:serine O-acetyltransferase